MLLILMGSAVIRGLGKPTICIGYFNCLLEALEKRVGLLLLTEELRSFRTFMATNGLLSLSFTGPTYTWCHKQLGIQRIWERLVWWKKNLISLRWINLYHKLLDALDLTCKSIQRRDTFQVKSTGVAPA